MECEPCVKDYSAELMEEIERNYKAPHILPSFSLFFQFVVGSQAKDPQRRQKMEQFHEE